MMGIVFFGWARVCCDRYRETTPRSPDEVLEHSFPEIVHPDSGDGFRGAGGTQNEKMIRAELGKMHQAAGNFCNFAGLCIASS
jgi:hypothetical protein